MSDIASKLIPSIKDTLDKLSKMPEWETLDQYEKKRLLKQAHKAANLFHRSGKGIQCCEELFKVQQVLDGKTMKFTNMLKALFGVPHRRAFRWLQYYKRMLELASREAIHYLATDGIPGFNKIGLGEIVHVLKGMPRCETRDRRALEEWRDNLVELLRQDRRARAEGGAGLSLDESKRKFIESGTELLRRAGLKTQAEKHAWLRDSVGIIMERCSVAGTLKTQRTPVPEGLLPRRGRPKRGGSEHPLIA